MLVSPTCHHCMAGAGRAVRVLAGFPQASASVLILWLLMLPDDSVAAATARAEQLGGTDKRIRHYWEGEGWSISAALRPVLDLGAFDPAASAWDVYLWHPPGVRWAGEPPRPAAWAFNFRDDPPTGGGVPAAQAVFEEWLDSVSQR